MRVDAATVAPMEGYLTAARTHVGDTGFAALFGGDCANRLEPDLLVHNVSVFDLFRIRFDSERTRQALTR